MRGYDGDDNITQEHVATKNAIQVILCQINIFQNQLTQNMIFSYLQIFTQIVLKFNMHFEFPEIPEKGGLGPWLPRFFADQLTLL